ncbi:MAG: putative membrane protein [Pseudohongiellaceae bacterium]|jgi:uncharacterized membrane protein
MFSLILGLILFISLHLTRELGLRPGLVGRCGTENSYKAAYSILALLGLGLIIWGMVSAPFIMLWQTKFELRYISHILMIPAFILIIAGNTPRSHLRAHIRNPMLAGVTFWGIAHLWSNGDLASVLLFGAMSVWSGFKFISLGLKHSTKAGQHSPQLFWDIIAVVAGLITYTLISQYHGQLFGVGLEYV